jgi:hypothetical protein
MKTFCGNEGTTPCILNLAALGGVEWSASRLGRFFPEVSGTSTYLIEGWVGSRADMDAVAKIKENPSLVLPGIEPRSSSL